MKKIYVENFGPVKKAELELRNINLLIGEQSIGKSTLAKLITILTDYLSLSSIIIMGDAYWQMQLKEYGIDIYSDDKYKIIFDLEENGKEFHLEITPNKLISYLISNGKRITNKGKMGVELFSLKPLYHQDFILKKINEYNAKKDKNELNHNDVTELFHNSLYVPAERIIYPVVTKLLPALTLAKSTVPKNLLRFMVDLENAKATYPKFDMPLLNISYQKENADDYFIIHENNKKFLLSAASSGVQSTLPLLLVLQYAIEHREYTSFVIEEPECNLFPAKQVELLKHIIKLVKNDNRILTITTHSPYLLSALNNYLFAGTLVSKYGDKISEGIGSVLPSEYQLKLNECSVYSLGEDINGKNLYCKPLIDSRTGMIDYNSLDGISLKMNAEFEQLEKAFIQMRRKK